MDDSVKIKICGITLKEEIDSLIRLNVEYAGFVVFFEKSRRNNTLEKAAELVKYLKEKSDTIKAVAVTVSPTLSQVIEIENSGFHILQVHGALLSNVKENCHLPIYRAFNVDSREKSKLSEILNDKKISGIVLDGAVAGSGNTFSWDRFKDFNRRDKEYVLAGGLNPENVGKAIKLLKPNVVDVSSGVEYDDKSKKGKDLEKIDKFVKAVRSLN